MNCVLKFSKMKLSSKEKNTIQFLFDYRLCNDTEQNQIEAIQQLKSIQGNFKEMFESTNSYHDDDRLTKDELKTIESIYSKLEN